MKHSSISLVLSHLHPLMSEYEMTSLRDTLTYLSGCDVNVLGTLLAYTEYVTSIWGLQQLMSHNMR